jgi:hypothetical protein
MNRLVPRDTPRYTSTFTLDNGRQVGVAFEQLPDAVGFVSRIVEPGEYWEVIDELTENVVMNAKEA